MKKGLNEVHQYGPAVVTLFGAQVPVLSFALAVSGLLLARTIAPSPVRKLSKKQEFALTALLTIITFLAVAGKFGNPQMGEGLATITGIGLGFSGLLVIETIGKRAMALLGRFMDAMDVLVQGRKNDDGN